MKYLIITYFLMLGVFSNAQGFLNDTIPVSPTGSYLHSLYEVDSGYYWVGMTPHPSEPGYPDQYVLGFISYEGNWEVKLLDYDTLQDQRAGFSYNSLIRNNAGNFVHAYSNCGSGNCYPRIKEVSPEGNIVRDTIYRDVTDSFQLVTYDGNNLYYFANENEYLLLANTVDTGRLEAGFSDFGTTLYLRINESFQIIDTVHIRDPSQTFSYLPASLCMKYDGTEVVMIHGQRNAGAAENREGKMVFHEIDQNGNEQKVAEYRVGQYEVGSQSLMETTDSAYVFTYIQSEWDELTDDWLFTNYICKLDTNYQLLWENPLFYTLYPTPVSEVFAHRVIETSDSNYVVSMGGGGTGNNSVGAVLMKFSADGEQQWIRRILEPIPSVQDTSYSGVEIRDLIENSKGGFTMIGRHNNYIQIPNFDFYYYGYIVETNCLGFLGSPEAAADYSVENNYEIAFVNQSLQAGSYTWDFGDGTIVTTDEYTDSISHAYSGFGTYQVMLIAHGCEEHDTLLFTVKPALHSDPSVVTEGQGYFSIFPNPLPQGQQLFVYLNQLDPADGTVWLQFVSSEGKIAEEITLTATEGTYFIAPKLGAGVYQVNLIQGDEILQSRKLIVM